MRLNDARKMVQTVWNEIPKYYPAISIGKFVIMPNHINGTTVTVGAGPCACPIKSTATTPGRKRRPTAIRQNGNHGGFKNKGNHRGIAPTGNRQLH
ncbi:MAG: hypothetical protein J7K96_02720 [Desulfobacteraceae bacterium]|nr:hypothetical protein [Desulfobacteraceae bacterium]